MKLLSALTLTGMLNVGAASNVLAQPNGYYVKNTGNVTKDVVTYPYIEYLMSDMNTHPNLITTMNDALGGNLDNLALDLNGKRANYEAYITSLNDAKASLDSFNAFATQNPFQVPNNLWVYNPANPSQPIPSID